MTTTNGILPYVALIVAIDEQNGIGRKGELLCHLPGDLKHFKEVTTGHTIVMGRKTYESLPKGALPNRTNIVLTSDNADNYPGCVVLRSFDEAIAYSRNRNDEKLFIIGGGQVYNASLPFADKLYITRIHHSFDHVDTFFPSFTENNWELIEEVRNAKDDKNGFDFSFLTYVRKCDQNKHKPTEQSSLHDDLDKKTVLDILTGINQEDQKVADAVHKTIPQIEKLVTGIVERMRRGGRLFYIGAGTSGRLGVLDASEIPPTFGMPDTYVIGIIAGGEKALRYPVEAAEDNTDKGWEELSAHDINQNDILVGIAASGTTPYVIGALRKAQHEGILTAAICCNPSSPVANEAEIKIEPIVGPEYVTGSTRMKAGTAQKMVLNMISTATMIKLGRVKGNRMVNMQLTNQKLIDRGTRMIVEELRISYKQAKNLLLLNGSVKDAIDNYNNHK